MITAARKYIRILAGVVVLVLGIILALPFVPGPGIPFIILGLMLLSDHFTWAKRGLDWAKEKWHHWHQSQTWSHGRSPQGSERRPGERFVGPANLRD